MNHAYRLVFNRSLDAWVAAPETARGRGKSRSAKALAVAVSLACGALSPSAFALDANALPSGGSISAGSGSLGRSGSTLTINQTSRNLAINWQSFNVGSNASVNFVQPDRSAIALNRVLGTDASAVYGHINANGQVFLLNPNGILFGPTAQVNVGGLVASTLGLSDADLQARNIRFTGRAGQVTNQGGLNAADGGYVALLGGQVSNQGVITARLGQVALGAGSDVTLDLAGDGLISLRVNQGALNALAENRQLIRADGGNVLLSARAADRLVQAVVNNDGVIEARAVDTRSGSIRLLGDADNGSVHLAGTLDASAPTSGNGGFIETSAQHVQVADSARVSTQAAHGRTGTWLIDPTDFTIAASGGDMTGAAVANALASNDLTIQSSQGAGGTAGDINVNDSFAWSAHTLTLSAQNNITINAPLQMTGTAGLALEYGLATPSAGNISQLTFNRPVDMDPSTSFTTRQGSDGAVQQYTWIADVGNLQFMQFDPGMNYVLTNNIDAQQTRSWNNGLGFLPIDAFSGRLEGAGHSVSQLYINAPQWSGVGLFSEVAGGSVSNLSLLNAEVTGNSGVGALAGGLTSGSILNVNVSGHVSGLQSVGGLMGASGQYGNDGGSIDRSRFSGQVSGNYIVGGLVGLNYGGSISNSSANGVVTGVLNPSQGAQGLGDLTGGLVGQAMGNSVFTNNQVQAQVSGGSQVGGLVGLAQDNTQISNSRSAGTVQGTDFVGGLVGDQNLGSISGSRADVMVTGSGNVVGGLAGRVQDASVDASTAAGLVTGGRYVGGLVGATVGSTLISHSHASGTVMGASNVGGLVGINDVQANLSQSDAGGMVTASGSGGDGTQPGTASFGVSHAGSGGLIGVNMGQISDSQASGRVVGFDLGLGGLVGLNYAGGITRSAASGDVQNGAPDAGPLQAVGGLVGFNHEGTISDSHATGAVSSGHAGNASAGGLVGANGLVSTTLLGGTIANSYATGPVSGSDRVGGLVGFNGGTVSGSFASGSVSGAQTRVGGLIGENDVSGILNGARTIGMVFDSYSSGVVTGANQVGGLIGLIEAGSVTNSYARNLVLGSGGDRGALVGNAVVGGTFNNTFWDPSANPGIGAVGTGDLPGISALSGAQWTQASSFANAGWNIAGSSGSSAVWRIYEGQSAPLLRGLLTPITITANSGSRAYDGTANGLGANCPVCPAGSQLLGTLVTTLDGSEVGNHAASASGLYSGPLGYDISYATGLVQVQPAGANAVPLTDPTTARASSGAGGVDAQALPAGAVVSAGSGTVSRNGATLTVNQSSANLAINWQSFNIGSDASVNFVQPDRHAIALNRVLGSDASTIYGHLSANGQVFLLNPNGVLFGPTAQVSVGGLVATTLGLSDTDLLANNYRFTGTAGAVTQQGDIAAAAGGYVALLGGQVSNQGRIVADQGQVALAAGSDTVLALDPAGVLGSTTVRQGAASALAENQQTLQADGGGVLLTALAAPASPAATVRNAGLIQARTLASGTGSIRLLADIDNGSVQVGGTLDASAPDTGNGGFVETSAQHVQVSDAARVSTRAAVGATGHWVIDPSDFTIAASGGDMTGAAVSAALAANNLGIQSGNGAGGTAGDINVNDAIGWSSNKLTLSAQNNINLNAPLFVSGGTAGLALEYGLAHPLAGNAGTYNVRAVVDIGGGSSFSTRLGSDGSTVNYTVIDSVGNPGSTNGHDLQAINADPSGHYVLGNSLSSGANLTQPLAVGSVFSGTFDGLGHFINDVEITGSSNVGLFGATGGTSNTIRDVTVLGANIQGFVSVGGLVGQAQGSTIVNSQVFGSVSGGQRVGGLVGYFTQTTTDGSIADSGFTGQVLPAGFTDPAAAANYHDAGGLVGRNISATIVDSHASGSVSSPGANVGGLVGYNLATIQSSHADATVLHTLANGVPVYGDNVGGLVGLQDAGGLVQQSYAVGNVNGGQSVGGLVGLNNGGIVNEGYSTGAVTGAADVGGLVGKNAGAIASAYANGAVGANLSTDTVVNAGGLVGRNTGASAAVFVSFWNLDANPALSGIGLADGGAGATGSTALSGAQWMQLDTFANAGWSISGVGGSTASWRIYDGQTAPLLRGLLKPLTITAASCTREYDGTTDGMGIDCPSCLSDAHLLGSLSTTLASKNAGNQVSTASGLYSDQLGYDISYATGVVKVTPRASKVSGLVAYSKVYDGDTTAAVDADTGLYLSGFIEGDVVGVAATGHFVDKNVGNMKTVVLDTTYTGADRNNYSFIDQTGTTASITPKALVVSGITAADKVYDGGTSAVVNTSGATLGGLVTGDALTVSATGQFADKNAANGKAVALTSTYSGADRGNYTVTDQASTTASITPKALTVSGITAADKVYDGGTSAVVSTSGATLGGLVAGDALTVSASGQFADKNAGAGKTVTLTSSYGGADLGNYAITDQASASASITPKSLTVSGITAADKIYDGGVSANVSTAAVSLNGLVTGDAVTVSASGSFADKNVGSGKVVSLTSNYAGADRSNYAVTGQASTTASITPKSLTVSGITAADKVYDGGTSATVSTAAVSLNGLVTGDAVTVSASGSFPDKNVGSGKVVSLTSSYAGADLSNYSIVDQTGTTASITLRSLTVTGITAADKVYDGGTSAVVSTSGATLDGLVAGDVLTVNTTGRFADKNVGTGKTVSLTSSYGGSDLENYAITDQASATAGITPKALTVSGITAADKVYDGGSSATVSTSGVSLIGLVAGDAVTVSASGNFADKNVGSGKVVSLASNYAGADRSNYGIADQASTTASITPKSLTVSGITAADKVYDGGTSAIVSTAAASLNGLITGDAVTVSANGSFTDKNVGNGKSVALSSTYAGADHGNYVFIDQAGTHASITPRALTVSGITATDKVYDGSALARLETANAKLTGAVQGDFIALGSTGLFGDKDVGLGKAVSLADALTGADAGNYVLVSQQPVTANITPKPLSITGTIAADKPFDGTTAATVLPGMLSGFVGSETVGVGSASGNFNDPQPGTNKPVTVTYVLADGTHGGLSTNYSLAPDSVRASIHDGVSNDTVVPPVGPFTQVPQPAYLAAMSSLSEMEARRKQVNTSPQLLSVIDGGMRLPAGLEKDQ